VELRRLAGTDLQLSKLGFGAAPLGDVYGTIDRAAGVRAVRVALDLGVNVIDVSPYYGRTLAETVLGKSLVGVDRAAYVLASKVGRYGLAEFDFTAGRVRSSVDESLGRLGVDYLDLVQVHDIEFGDLDQIVAETVPALYELRDAGKIRYVGATGSPLGALGSVAARVSLDTILSYCRYTLLDQAIEDWLPFFQERGTAVLNASPLAMGALTARGAPDWHPAPRAVLECCARAARFSGEQGTPLEKMALQFSAAHPAFATTFVGMADEQEVRRNIAWVDQPPDDRLLAQVRALIAPVHGSAWPSGRPENDVMVPPRPGGPA
jgi:L-galactose dehydrogenase